MGTIGIITAAATVAGLLLAARSPAGPPGATAGAGGGWNLRNPSAYDADNIASLSGEVTGVDLVASLHGTEQGVHLTLKTAKEVASVILGPQWYIARQRTQIRPGIR